MKGIVYETHPCAIDGRPAYGFIKTRTTGGYYCELHFWAIYHGTLRPAQVIAPPKQESRLLAG